VTDATSAEMFKRGKEFLESHRHAYLSSGGKQGHIIDLSPNGGRPFATHLLLKYVGRKTGKTYINPLFYGLAGGEVVIIASKGGADQHPSWYLNLTAGDEVRFQIGTQAFRGTWRQPSGSEREALWNFMVGNHPPFVAYQAATARQIPVILLRAIEEIPIFSVADAA
jgi:deazaflavin-dependent oxidoreductase (nitroreductase family)